MRRIPYCCSDHRSTYANYYNNQVGGSVYAGAPYQRGYGGLSNMLGSLFKSAVPLLKSGAKSLAKTALNTGLNIASDALSGKNIRNSASKRFKQAGSEVLSNVGGFVSGRSMQPSRGSSLKVRKKRKKPTRSLNSKRKRPRDIFG